MSQEKARNALTAVFPNIKSISDFIKDSEGRKRLWSFIDFAARHGLIESKTNEAFNAFILSNSRSSKNESLNDLTMEELINNKEDYLSIRISNKALIDKINALLSKNGIKMPQLSRAMFTRLKKHIADTPRKRDALRSFAFWIGYERSEMGKEWHYETLKDLCCEDSSKIIDNFCGIRMAFSINSRGIIIGQNIVAWMKRTIKNTLMERKDLFNGLTLPKVRNHDLNTFQLDLPNTDQSAIPAAYANTLKKAITIAHQIAIQWMISGFANYNRFFSIGIAAGHFDEINNQLQAILNVKLPEDPVIRLTDYTQQCSKINQIKVILNHIPEEIELFSGEAFKVWWIIELSGFIYWDLVPRIISKGLLGNSSFNSFDLRRQLTIPNRASSLQDNDAINCFLKFPRHQMLGFEIARAFLCKKKISSAIEIINAILRVSPHHQNSRIMRMMLYRLLGGEASNYYLSTLMFRMAENEANYILETLGHTSEDFYYEYGILKLAQLSTAIKVLQQHDKNIFEIRDIRLTTADLITMVNQAEEVIIQGLTVSSPTAERIIHLFLSVQVLKLVILENIKDDGGINQRLTCPNNKIKQHMYGLFISLYNQEFDLETSDITSVLQFVNEIICHNDSLVALEVFKPEQFFNNAVFYWDIIPVRNVAIINATLEMLKKALISANTCALKKDPVYSITNLSGQFISADQFISQINSIIKEIERRYQKKSELEIMDPTSVIGRAEDDLVLMTYYI